MAETGEVERAQSFEPDYAMQLPSPLLVFLGDETDPAMAKTGFGLRDWAGDRMVGEWGLTSGCVTLGLPRLAPAEAKAAGARAMVIGIANVGGVLPDSWRGALFEAMAAGLDIVSGMHARLAQDAEIASAAAAAGVRLHDVRVPKGPYPVGTGEKRTGLRLLTVGTDCALGKKYTALAMARAIAARGGSATFRATGQTGIMIAGTGVPLDAVVADFISGAAETLSPAAAPRHWDVIEGQGSILHPGYAGVTVGLVHGSQPDAMVLCHDPDRTVIHGVDHILIPPLPEVMRRYLELAQLTNGAARFVGVALNTSRYDDIAARRHLDAAADMTGLPAIDPLRFGTDPVLARLEAEFGAFA